jgi:putative transcriptional regulator
MASTGGKPTRATGYLDGQLLIAMPTMGDQRFSRTVIYLCSHSADGAMGIVVNKPAENLTFPSLLDQLGISERGPDAAIRLETFPVNIGGPVETARGFVLHSSDYHAESCTLPIDDGIALTATVDILKAIAAGAGPDRALLALGYAGWAPGQLEMEIQANGWLHCDPDLDLIFDHNFKDKYDRALAKIGVDPSMLVSGAGHA